LGSRFLKYIFSALSSCLLDLLLFAVLCHFLKGSIASYIIISTVIARVISATYNYTINRKLVFESRKGVGSSAGKYVLLAVIQMAASAGLVTLACHFITFMPEVVIKAIIDTILFFISYHIQQKYVF
jgi:putative flippase GtrA